jgi:pimeloyl-ACP methyl ester carboxylesterase
MPWGLAILLLSGLGLGWALLTLYTALLLSRPPRRGYAWAVSRNLPGDPAEIAAPGAPRGLPFTEWTAASRGRALPVWDCRGLNPSGPAILIAHGWGDSRVVMLARAAALAPLASRIVLFDLPAHGDAPPGGFTLGLREHEDIAAVAEAMDAPARSTAHDSADARPPLVLYGYSLGAGCAILAATELARRGRPPAAVIAEAPYRVPPVPARNVMRLRGLPHRSNLRPALALLGLRFGAGLSWALTRGAGGFDRALHAARLPAGVPLLVVHGQLDPVCPPADGRAIAAAAPSARYAEIPAGAHTNLWTDPALAPRTLAAVAEFLAGLTPAAAPTPEPAATHAD